MVNFTPSPTIIDFTSYPKYIDNNWFNPFPPLSNIFMAVIIVIGIIAFSKIFWMAVYEFKYGHGAGKLYLKFGKEIFKR